VLPVLQVDVNRVNREDSGREQLLALFRLWRGLESGSSNNSARAAMATMTPDTTMAASDEQHSLGNT